ncbi:MAG: polysaccharide pyruvyl transferase family protein [Clostridia bacterium]|nr:polysaccharide pyruvyl transferase family protein [Clostridia bacterium]
METQNNAKIVYYFHAGSENHGCEAIVRATTDLLGTRPWLFSENPAGDERYAIDAITELKRLPPVTYSFADKLRIKLSGDELAYRIRAGKEAASFPEHAVALSIGGDNYCYGDTYNWHLAGLNESLHKRGVKTVLWGCSIDPESVTDKMKRDFARYDLIVAREHISYDFLKAINPHTVYACDPAFTLKEERLPLPAAFVEGHTVGINVSPLIQKSERVPGITLKNYQKLLSHILENTDYHVAFIPHVVQAGNDDREPLRALLEGANDPDRVCLIEDANCMQLKGYIARCALFVGARTHATIAAYSSCVPTLVVGYSTKAKGIARDLFGTEDGYVLPVQSLRMPDDLTAAFAALDSRKEAAKAHLVEIMPAYQETVRQVKEQIRMLSLHE